jgi:hypothetical protein
MDHEKVLAQIYLHLEANDVEKAVTGCLRLSRSTKDYLNTAVLRIRLTNPIWSPASDFARLSR